MLRKSLILLPLILIFGLFPASAQESSPLLALLARIPNTPSAHTGLTYADYRALLTARPGTPSITSVQDYDAVISEGNGFTLLCGMNGCYPGRHADPNAVDPTNPFGTMGLVQPVIVSSGLVASSSALQNLAGIQAAIHGDLSNLGGDSDIRAAAEAISLNRTLLQAEFIDPEKIRPLSSAAGKEPNDNQTSAITQMSTNFVPMPAYNLIALADTTTESEQQALVGLVYSNQADAEAAAVLFPEHLQQYISLKANKTLAELLTSAGVTSIEASVYSSSTGRFVLVLTLHAPLPGTEISGDGKAHALNAVYTLLAQAYRNRDLEWLATQL